MEKCCRLFSKRAVIFLAVVLGLLGVGCSGQVFSDRKSPVNEVAANSKDNISTLKIGLILTGLTQKLPKSLISRTAKAPRAQLQVDLHLNTKAAK